MSKRVRCLVLLAAAAMVIHLLRRDRGHETPGGILIEHATVYDMVTRWLLRPIYRGIADDIAATASDGTPRILEVGCGPGHLAMELARHGFVVTAIDLDPVMIGRAQANANRLQSAAPRPSFEVADVAELPFLDRSFDLVVSTLSVHHWADPAAGLKEIGRVLRAGGKALVWDIRPGGMPFHTHVPNPVDHIQGSRLRVTAVTPWRWPWGLTPIQRVELALFDE